MAHITGGGLLENIPRVLPDGLSAAVDLNAWPLPPIFAYLAKTGRLDTRELARTFNCGIGMVLIVSPSNAPAVLEALVKRGERAYTIGKLVPRCEQVRFVVRAPLHVRAHNSKIRLPRLLRACSLCCAAHATALPAPDACAASWSALCYSRWFWRTRLHGALSKPVDARRTDDLLITNAARASRLSSCAFLPPFPRWVRQPAWAAAATSYS